jgi:type IV pilus assembly protein PilY1
LGFGYVVSGVAEAEFKVHSGVNNFQMADTGCNNNCNVCDVADTVQYTLGASTDKDLKDPLFYAAKWGGYSKEFEDGVAKKKGVLVDSIKGRDTSDSYFYATDPRALEQSLETALANIAATVGASATVAANSTRLDGETFVYQARFNSSDWSGDILAFKVDPETGLVDTSSPDKAKWRASEKIKRTGRTIYTYDGASTPALVKLTSAGPTAAPTLREALKVSGETGYTTADNRFYWLLGSADNESNANLRKREVLLGDIVNADPAFAGAGNLRYRFLPKAYGSGLFPAFAKEKRELLAAADENTPAKRKWRSLLLVGANDGMMHAFDAETGSEVFAYIPRGVYSKLADLSSLQYRHQYTVDGPISIGDVYFDKDSDGTGGEWRTIAVGTLGAGGRGIYALDITKVLNSSDGKPEVIFDVSAEDPATPAALRDSLGYSMSRAMIVPTRDSNWKVIVGNGPNSNNGTASLIVIDPENPNNYKVIDSEAKISTTSTDNGLFGVALLPNANGVIEAAYGGDLMGNMWKFDLSGARKNDWDVAHDNQPLARVVDKSGVPQPITATPTLGSNTLKTIRGANGEELPSTMVYFGTGKYYESADPRNMQVQSFYGIADIDSLVFTDNASRRGKLEEKEIEAESASGGVMKRTINNDVRSSSATRAVDRNEKYGWFIDLQVKDGDAKGERVIGKPLLIYDRLIFSTFVPSTNQCGYGGAGWLMELTGVGDKYVGKSVLGVNANTSLDTPILGDLIALSSGDNLHIMGSGLGKKNLEPPIISKQGNSFGDKGRISWQQLK